MSSSPHFLLPEKALAWFTRFVKVHLTPFCMEELHETKLTKGILNQLQLKTVWRSINISIVCMAVLLLSMGTHCSHNVTSRPAPCSLSPELCKLVAEWRKDVGGCLHIRTFGMAQNITNSMPTNLLNLDSLQLYLGPADNRRSNFDYKTLEYYYYSTCSGSAPVDSSDKQWVEFAFDAQTRQFKSVSKYAQ